MTQFMSLLIDCVNYVIYLLYILVMVKAHEATPDTLVLNLHHMSNEQNSHLGCLFTPRTKSFKRLISVH